jgi:hypothetical protein
MAADNNLICFTNCLLALEDGSLVPRDLWIDSELGLILDAQVQFFHPYMVLMLNRNTRVAYFLCDSDSSISYN